MAVHSGMWGGPAGDAGLLDGVDLLGTGTITERLTHNPAIAVLGIDAPPVDGADILLPRARAMVSTRLAPGQYSAAAVAAITEHCTLSAMRHGGRGVSATPHR